MKETLKLSFSITLPLFKHSSGHHIGQHRFRTFSSIQEVLLQSVVLDKHGGVFCVDFLGEQEKRLLSDPGSYESFHGKLGLKQQSVSRYLQAASLVPPKACLYSLDVRITTEEHCFHEGDGKGGCVYSSIKAEKAKSYVRN